MGRKKNKKNTQKQVEVATPPESLNTTAPAEEPPANEAPPPEVVSDEVPVESVPDPNPGDSQDNTKESEASLAAETLDHSENTAPESDHMGSSLAVPEEQSTVPATESQELGPTKEEQSTEVLPDQLLEIEAEAHLATEQTSEMSSEIFDIEDASIETPMAQDEIEETAQVEEATAETEPVAAETQLDQEEPSDPSAEIPVENGPAPEIVEELPTEPPEDITPESPIEETSEFVEAQEQLDQDETASAAETPVINDLSSELPPAESSEEKPEEALAVEALEPPIQEDEAPSAPDSEAEAEAEQAEKEQAEKEQAEKEQAEQERLEQERIEQEKFEQEKLEQEKLEQEKLEQEKFEQEKLEQEKLEQEKLEQEKLEQEKLEQEKLEQEKLEQERIEQEMLEAQRVEEERIEKEKVEAAELAQKQALEAEAEATRLAEEKKALEAQTQADAEAEAARIAEEEELKKAASASETAQELVFEADSKPTNLSTPPPEALAEPPTAPSVPANDPVNRLPTPAETVDRSNSPHSVATDASKTKPRASEPSPKAVPAHRSMDANHIAYGRQSSSSPMTAPKPQAVSQLLEESRPPAPSPPIGRVRPRHISTFDSEDDSDSALVRPRRQYRGGEEFARDSSGSGPGYPPQPAHHRSVFASRVPTEPTYSNPPPPQPPGYHPGFYPPTAPPHYPDHNYRMSQPGYSHPNSYGPPSHSSSSPYTESWNYSSGYRHNSPPQRHDTLVSRDYPLGLSPLDQRGDDPGEVFSRIAQAIPDLHVLLARYKETHGQLTVREELLRRSAVEQEEKLRIKDGEIAELRERSHNLEQKYSSEASRLRLQIGNLEEQARELQEQRTETEKYKKEAQDTKTALDAAMRSWEAKYKELEEAHTALARTSAEEKAKAYQDFDEWKSTYTTRNDAEKIALAIQFDKRLKEADVLAENQRQEMATAHVKEKEELRSEHQSRQLERQVSFERIRTELETKLGAAQIDREEALKHERESREVWLAEREGLIKSHQDDRESLRKGWDEHRDLLETQYKKNKDESDKAWMELHADASHKADEEKTRANQLVQEKEELQKSYNALKAESEQEKSIIKSVATNLESEKARLEKLMECYGDIAEIKSKGDTYYLVSFSQLQKQIIDLATTHFVHLPVRPPAEELAQVPSNLPSFLGDTVASRQVRAAYVAHTVSKLITYRVFGPFLFSLGRRYDKADSLFLSMSHHIRDKSTRKEAIWRQQTLLAAFTSSGAKQRINTAAGSVVEEIVNAIKHFADPREEEGIKIAVKRIVKLAAETWRFARLEREMINATMPALLDEEHQFTGPEFWPSYESYKPEGSLIGSLLGTSHPADERPQLLLRLFPVIWREAKHENFHAEGEKPDEGSIYHHGLALYDDAEPVVQRMEELKSAGLPSYTTTTSPTTAESGKFPPPIVPPPREAPPPPPTAYEKGNRSSIMSAPRSPTDFLDKSSIRQATPPPPPSSIPTLDEPTFSEPVKAYKRPPPGPIDFMTPRDLIGLPPPIESMIPSQSHNLKKRSIIAESTASKSKDAEANEQPAPVAESIISKLSAPRSNISRSRASISVVSGPPAPELIAAESTIVSSLSPPHVADVTEEPRQPSPSESAIIPTSFPEPSPNEGKSRDPPTPPLSRSGSPTERPLSPLFEAIDEIEALQNHRSRQSSSSLLSRRRSTHSRRSKDEMPEVSPTTDRPETSRRTSGYALSTRSTKTVDSERTDRSDKSGRDPKSRYMCESRSAAVKALYPNSPLATTNGSVKDTSSTKGSVSSSKKRDRDSKELKREKSFLDNGTWDTSSNRTSEGTNTQFSTV